MAVFHRVSRVANFLGDRSGNFAVIASLLLVVIMTAVGIAIDLDRLSSARDSAQTALDSAVLATLKDVHEGKVGTDRNSLEDSIKKFFDANNGTGAFASDYQLKQTNVSLKNTQLTVTSDITVPTTFMAVIGRSLMNTSVTSAAGLGSTPADIYLAVDSSASMLLADDAAERQKLMALTKNLMIGPWAIQEPDGCMFACHQSYSLVNLPAGQTLYDIAMANGVRIREDTLSDAVDLLIGKLLSPAYQAKNSGNLRIGVFGFSANAMLLAQPTDKISNLNGVLSKFPDSDRDRTHFDQALPQINTASILQSGSRKRIIVLVTDGVNDTGTMTALDPKYCQVFKDTGAVVYVVDINYLDASGDTQFDYYVAPFYDKLPSVLRECASDGKYYSATDSASMATAFSKLASEIDFSTLMLTR